MPFVFFQHPIFPQIVDVCEEYQKENKLAKLLEEIGCEQGNKILVFVETKRKADELTRLMRKDGWPAMCIHGRRLLSSKNYLVLENNEFNSIREFKFSREICFLYKKIRQWI